MTLNNSYLPFMPDADHIYENFDAFHWTEVQNGAANLVFWYSWYWMLVLRFGLDRKKAAAKLDTIYYAYLTKLDQLINFQRGMFLWLLVIGFVMFLTLMGYVMMRS